MMISKTYKTTATKRIGYVSLSFGLALSSAYQPLYAAELEVAPYLSAAFTYDDNVYLLADQEDALDIVGEDDRSDNIVDIEAGLDGTYESRSSKIKFGARVFRQDYSQFSVLDFTGGTANAKGEWKLNKRFIAQANYRYERNQSNFSEQNLAQGDVFDLHRVEAGITFLAGENKDLYLKAAFRDKDYEQRFALANQRTDISVGYRQFSRKNSWLGVEFTHADGDYPNRLGFANDTLTLQDYTEDSVRLLSNWQFGEKTRIEANIGYVDREHNDSLSAFDFDGLIFDIDVEWDISSKTQLNAQVIQRLRDTENTNTLFNREQRLTVGLEWTASERLMLNAALTLLDIDFIQQGENREDTGSILEFGAAYDIGKRSSLEPKIRVRTRDSNDINSEYDNTSATISYRYAL